MTVAALPVAVYPYPQTFALPNGGVNAPGIAFNVKWTNTFFNQSQKTLTGASRDIALAPFPIHQFELTYEFLRDFATGSSTPTLNSPYPAVQAELRRVQGFYMAMGGQRGRFAFNNADDNNVSAQLIATSDGATVTYPLFRDYGDLTLGYALTSEPVGFVDPAQPFTAFDNGTPISAGSYNVTQTPGAPTITLGSPLTTGHQLSVSMSYLYYCKFADDSATFEKFLKGYWLIQSVKIQSCRPGA